MFKQTRNKKSDKINSVKLLEGESQKLKDKLEALKQQIKVKKQQKIMNKTSQSNGIFPEHKHLVQSKMNKTNYIQKDDKRLSMILSQLKIQNIEQKLKEKHIFNIDQFYSLKDEQIDNWKDISVGYRIKIKKYIEKNKNKNVPSLNIIVNQEQQDIFTESNNKNIEDIIKNRKNDMIYVPLDRQQEQIQQDQRQQLTQFQQQKMMISILSFLGGKERTSSIKNKSSQRSNNSKRVHWSKDVDQLESSKHELKKYPKEVISKKIFNQKISQNIEHPIKKQQKSMKKSIQMTTQRSDQQFPNYKYCWSCLKRISIFEVYQNKQFCSSSCLYKYQQIVNPKELLQKFQQCQLKYGEYLKQKAQLWDEYLDLDIL